MKITVEQKLKLLSNKELIQLTNELKHTSVPNNALLREVIKDTELDTTAPILAFVGVGQWLAFELADRLIVAQEEIEAFHSHDNPSY
jgi:hypothetical protein